jgi:hypothetical protein
MKRMQEVNSAYAALRFEAGTKVDCETHGWTNVDRGRVTAKLLNRGISHSWDDGELVIDRKSEGQSIRFSISSLARDWFVGWRRRTSSSVGQSAGLGPKCWERAAHRELAIRIGNPIGPTTKTATN